MALIETPTGVPTVAMRPENATPAPTDPTLEAHRPPVGIQPEYTLATPFTKENVADLEAKVAPQVPPETESILGDAIHTVDTTSKMEQIDPARTETRDEYEEILENGELSNWIKSFAADKKREAQVAEQMAEQIDGLGTLGHDPKFKLARELGIITAHKIDQGAFNQRLDELIQKNLDQITDGMKNLPDATAQITSEVAAQTQSNLANLNASIAAVNQTMEGGTPHVPTADQIENKVTTNMPGQLEQINAAVNNANALLNQTPAHQPVATTTPGNL